jgi:septal ring factor EnvC (AmiA/AmiB activator)
VWLAYGMSVLPLPDLDALSLDELKKLVVQLLVEVTALREENQQLRAETARLKALPKKPKLAPGGMDKATEPDKRAKTKQARRQRRNRQSGRRTPPVTEERTLVIETPAGSRRRGFEPFTVQDLLLVPSSSAASAG